jgi:hypothetical protein
MAGALRNRQSLAMSLLRRMSLPQRAVVVAFGLALLASPVWWYLGDVPDVDGWFAYTPNSRSSTDT